MCTADDTGGTAPDDRSPGAGPGAGSRAGFRSVADALQASHAAATYLNSPAAADLDGPARGEALLQLGAITSLLGAATNGLLRRFDADYGHDADGYATSAAKMVPDRAGADTRVDVRIGLRDLLEMDGASVIEDTWLRARAGEHGYLSGKDAEAVACDALIVPVVTGSPNWELVSEMVVLVTEAYNAIGRIQFSHWRGPSGQAPMFTEFAPRLLLTHPAEVHRAHAPLLDLLTVLTTRAGQAGRLLWGPSRGGLRPWRWRRPCSPRRPAALPTPPAPPPTPTGTSGRCRPTRSGTSSRPASPAERLGG